ncbi:MBL fold metallo-hydrolase [uncultured Clostridium sp.]|uniref:MBL fold metallo-hydrolase n=1 Tax=uncultured Clostridium sp. TaxID=59620 RepID=UPI002631C613|nr:MBL fold metallo-hydrolase [uncultured Clostridium sp.]
MSRLEVIELKYEMNGNEFPVNLAVVEDENEMVLVDCGLPNSFELIKEKMAEKNLDINKLTKVIITHQDQDHMGSLKEIKDNVKGVQVLASEEESKYISGKEEFLRIQNINKAINNVDEETKKTMEAFKARVSSVQTVEVDRIVKDGDILDIAGGIEIIETPGHLPGHISVLIKKEKALVTGDALVVENGVLLASNPQYTLDMEMAKKSIKKLLNYDIETLICYHGGIFSDNVKEKIREF